MTLVEEVWAQIDRSSEQRSHVKGQRSSFSKYLSKTFVNQGEQSKLTIEALDPEYEMVRPQNKISSQVTENDLCPALSEIPSEIDSGIVTKREKHF